MKIGILTLHSSHQYGVVLQTWALQDYLQSLGHTVEIINFRNKRLDNKNSVTRDGRKKLVKHFKDFEEFFVEQFHLIRKISDYEQLCQMKLDYDAIIVSNEVWKSSRVGNNFLPYYLQFGDENLLRIAYAGSVGNAGTTRGYKIMGQAYFHHFDALSTREVWYQKQMQELGIENMKQVVDPVLLLDSKRYGKLESKCKAPDKYIFVESDLFTYTDDVVEKVGTYFHEQTELPMIISSTNHYIGKIGKWLSYIKNAEYVLTNSYYGFLLALQYKKNVYCIPRSMDEVMVDDFAEQFDLKDRVMKKGLVQYSDFDMEPMNYDELTPKLEKVIADSKEFLMDALACKKSKRMERTTYLTSKDSFACYGCSLCAQICPEDAITMESDAEGFYYPVVDEEKCTDCGLCSEKCVYTTSFENAGGFTSTDYVTRLTDAKELPKVSGGGTEAALCKKVIEDGGVVVGTEFNEEYQPEYSVATTLEQCEKLWERKPIEYITDDIYAQMRSYIEQGKDVLFLGFPCMVEAVHQVIDSEHLITIAYLCQGNVSPVIMKEYTQYMLDLYESPIEDLTYSHHYLAQNEDALKIVFETGSEYVESERTNMFTQAKEKGLIQRFSCYQCAFMEKQYDTADISLGVFKQSPKGQQDVCRIHTQKGMKLLEKAKYELDIEKTSFEKIKKSVPDRSLACRVARGNLFERMKTESVDEILASY